MKVNIENYQAIKKAELSFDKGLTVIVGSSNNGKSSIIRAIEAAINNKGGSDFINYDSDNCKVIIEDDENKVIWSKNRNSMKSYYDINGQVLKKIGQKQIEDVGKTLNMPEIEVNNDRFRLNFWKQLDFPFLVGKTHYQLFDFISKSKDQELMSNLLESKEKEKKDSKKELQELNTRIDTRTQDISSMEKEIELLKDIEDFDVSTFEKLITVVQQYESLLSQFEMIPDAIIAKRKEITDLDNQISTLDSKLTKIESLIKDYEKEKIFLDKLTKGLEEIKTLEKSIQDNLLKHDSLNRLSVTTEKELDSFDVCPFCQQPINKEGGHEHVK